MVWIYHINQNSYRHYKNDLSKGEEIGTLIHTFYKVVKDVDHNTKAKCKETPSQLMDIPSSPICIKLMFVNGTHTNASHFTPHTCALH